MQIRKMSPEDVDAVCEILALAFADNPNTLAVVRGDRAKARRMMRAAARAAKVGRACSHVWLAEKAGRLVGVLNAAEWPRCQLSIGEKVKIAPAMIRAAGSSLSRSMKMMSVWARHDPREYHWHIGPIGVHPELQGEGIGTALLRSFLEGVDERRLPAYLETDVDRNVVLYRRFGFEVVGQEDVNGVNNRFMWRPPRA
jgi:ribosomal protein S18 acetylase RimI-like enzyme